MVSVSGGHAVSVAHVSSVHVSEAPPAAHATGEHTTVEHTTVAEHESVSSEHESGTGGGEHEGGGEQHEGGSSHKVITSPPRLQETATSHMTASEAQEARVQGAAEWMLGLLFGCLILGIFLFGSFRSKRKTNARL